MALVDNAWYVDFGNGSTTGYYGVTVFPAATTVAAGAIYRQATTPAVGNERCFVVTVGGLTVAEPTWTVTRGAANTSGAATFSECTGIAGVNGDLTNSAVWVASSTWVQGQVIYDSVSASLQYATTGGAGGTGSAPAFSATAGTTTADNVAVWTSLGLASVFTGTTWQAPHARLANAFASTWGQAGNAFFVASQHAETQSSALTATSPGTLANPCFVYCVAKTTVPPTSTTVGATITTTGTSALEIAGSGYFAGLSLSAGTGAGLSTINLTFGSGSHQRFDNCAFISAGTNTNGNITSGAQGFANTTLAWNNCTVQFSATAQSIKITTGNFRWSSTASAIAGATIPTTLITPNGVCIISLIGVDLSALSSGTIIGATSVYSSYILQDCKYGASVTVAATPTNTEANIYGIRSDSSGTNYRHEKYAYTGTQTVTTTFTRSGGASDGTTAIAWNITTTANSKWILPFESIPITIWNGVTASNVTVTVHGLWASAGALAPANDAIWMEVEFLGTSGNPLGVITTTTKASNLAAGSAGNKDLVSSWSGSLANAQPFYLQAVLSSPQPQFVGYINVTIKAATASTTFYIDPLIVLS